MDKFKLFKNLLLILLLLSYFESTSQICTNANLQINVDFNQRQGSNVNYTQSMVSTDFNGLDSRAAGDIRGFDRPGKTWPQDNTVGQGVFRANYPANIAGGTNTGFLFDKNLPDSEEAVMEYDLKFGPDFYWAGGGKLPGLGGSSLSNVGAIPVGCTKDLNKINNGFSARLMWRQQTRAGSNRPPFLVVYTYFPDRDISKCGVDIKIMDIVSDRWYKVRQYIKLNTPGVRNGILEMYIDDELVLQRNDILYRNAGKSNVKINSAIFHSYRGGSPNDALFHSPNNENIFFDNFKVWTGCEEPEGSTSNIVQMTKRNASNYAIDGNNGGANAQSVYLWTKNANNVNQKWVEINRGGGYYSYQKLNTNFCIDGGNNGANNQDVYLWSCDDANYNQHWKKIDAGNGYYRLEKRNAPGYSIDGGNNGSIGQNVKLWSTSATNHNQHWLFQNSSSLQSANEFDNLVNNKIINQETDLSNTIVVYPNPSYGAIYVDLKERKNVKIDIMNVDGRILHEISMTERLIQLDLPQGVYFLRISSPDSSEVRRIIIH